MLTASEYKAWLAARRRGITGTDVAAILGLNRYRNALDVYLEKLGQGDPVKENEFIWWGRYLEEGMARRYAELAGLTKGALLRGAAIATAFPKSRVQIFGRGPKAQVLVRHRVYPFLLATFDGLTPSIQRGLELKTASDHMADEWGEQGTDQVPLHYLTQCAHYMAVSEFPAWDVGALIGAGARISGNLALYSLQRNRSLEAELIDTAVRFWREHVQKRIPPQIDGSSSWQSYLAKKYAKGTGVVLRATAPICELAQEYREAQERRQQAENAEMLVRNKLATVIQSADKARGDFGTVGWVRPDDEQVVDWEAFGRSKHPTTAELKRFTKTVKRQPYVRAWWSRKAEQQ